jgi:protein O-GlcNAc transferase
MGRSVFVPRDALRQAVELFRRQRFEQAALQCAAILRSDPQHFEGLYLLGMIRGNQGRLPEAIGFFERAAGLRPGAFEPHRDLGRALTMSGRHAEAIASFERALAIEADADLYHNLGEVLSKVGRHEAAIASFRKALANKPGDASIHNAIAMAQTALQRYPAAVASFEKALSIQPRNADIHFNLGVALRWSGRLDAAVASFERALAFNPEHVAALNSLGNALKRVGRHDAALTCFEKVLAIDPGHANATGMRAQVKRHICDWREVEQVETSLLNGVRSGRVPIAPFTLLNVTDDPAIQFACVKRYWQGRDSTPASPKSRTLQRDRLRVGYLSADFHEHAIAYLTAQLFEEHDRSRFELYAFSYGIDDRSAIRHRLEKSFDKFFDVRSKTDADIAGQIRSLEIDILVDLAGLTADNRIQILADRPAPVQVHYLGYPGTLGASFIDYLIVDPFIVPVEQQQHYTERLVYLPQCYQVNDGKRPIDTRQPGRAECDLPDSGFVFCCFNQSNKITPPVFDVWMRLLTNVPGSVMWLLFDNRWAQDNLRREAANRGVSPDRIVFAPRRNLSEHLARHRLADLFLDTIPYNAHTTASDALWAGLPVLTCAGRSFASRVAGSLLHAVGLPELVCGDLLEYERLAFKLAREPALSKSILERLERTRATAPLFDCARTCRHIEAAYSRMWETWTRREPPRSFAVDTQGG